MKDFIFTIVIIITLLFAISFIFSKLDKCKSGDITNYTCNLKENFKTDKSYLEGLFNSKLLDTKYHKTASMTSKQYYDSIWRTPITPLD